VTLSHVFGGWEVHGEALLQRGSSRLLVEGECADDPAGCLEQGRALASRPLLDGPFRPRTLVGARYLFGDSSLASVEYSFNGDGLDGPSYQRWVRLLARGREDPRIAAALTTAPTDPGSPQRFSFDPLRRHYLFLSYSKPQIHDDFTDSAAVVLSLADLSGQLNPSLTWSARPWLSLTLGGYLTLPSPGDDPGELALSPVRWRILASARAYF
jgi:hypothetical protein